MLSFPTFLLFLALVFSTIFILFTLPDAEVEYPLADFILYYVTGLLQLLDDGLPLQTLHVEVVGWGGKYEEGHHRRIAAYHLVSTKICKIGIK